jgi:hypothetical protein
MQRAVFLPLSTVILAKRGFANRELKVSALFHLRPVLLTPMFCIVMDLLKSLSYGARKSRC